MSMFDPYEPAEPLKTLEELTTFVLVDARVRPAVETEYGKREPVDLIVQTTDPEKTRTFGGFSAGIVGQAKRKADGDLPAVVTIVEADSGKGNPTKILNVVEKLDAGADLAAIAAAQPTPIQPLSAQTEAIPY